MVHHKYSGKDFGWFVESMIVIVWLIECKNILQ